MRLPTIHLGRVYHAGTMNAALRSQSSYEGDNLSVSLCPHAWARIAKLGRPPLYELTTEGSGHFLDGWRVLDGRGQKALRDALAKWTLQQGLAVEIERFKAWNYDSDAEIWRYSIHDSKGAADGELDDDRTGVTDTGRPRVDAFVGYRPLPALMEATGIHTVDTDALESSIYLWAQDQLNRRGASLSGVFWREGFDPEAYSAPRGAILREALGRFKAVEVSWDDVEDVETLPNARLVEMVDQGLSLR